MNMSLKTIRKSKNLTQEQAANILAVSLRSYKDYENNPSKVDTIKYNYFIDTIGKYNPIDESHGLLSLNMIKDKCFPIFQEYNISYALVYRDSKLYLRLNMNSRYTSIYQDNKVEIFVDNEVLDDILKI